mmetsp:Transcript_63283/g.100481  ORF Transcript_63283/g.100481 Transcript_63283/m.100481 type:complete len:331 (+) Transcript_63283:1-993(+)
MRPIHLGIGGAALLLLALSRRRKRGALRGQRVLITGASHGIGQALALKAAELGAAELILVDLDSMDLVAKEAQTIGASAGQDLRVSTYKVDVRLEDVVATLCARISMPHPPQVVLLSAGVVAGQPFLPVPEQQTLSAKDLRRTMETNFLGSAWFAQQLLPGMLQQPGALVFISSMMGVLGSARLSDYCASKWALLGFSESLRLELRARQCGRVGIMAVCPYLVDTQMFCGAFEGADRSTWFRRCVGWLRSLVFSKLHTEDVAAAILAQLDHDLSDVPPQLFLPWHAGWVPVLLRSLPASVQEILLDLGGGCFGMDSFRGKNGRVPCKVLN